MIDQALNLVLFIFYLAALPVVTVVWLRRRLRPRLADDGVAERQVTEAEIPAPLIDVPGIGVIPDPSCRGRADQ